MFRKKAEQNSNKKQEVKKESESNQRNKKLNFRFILIAVILICIFCIAITPVTLQNDTFYTVEIGEHIMKYGVDMQDPFSWHQDLSYTYPHWLYDVLTYLVYSVFNFGGIYVITVILSCILGLSIYFVSSKITKNNIIPFFITIGAMYLLKGYIAARAQLVTFILFIFAIYFIEMFLKNKKKRYAVGLVLISLLIANLHCAVWPFLFILFLPYIGEYLVVLTTEDIIYGKTLMFFTRLKIRIISKYSKNKEKLKELKEKLKTKEEKNDRIKIKRDKELQNAYKIKIQKNNNVKWLILIMIICVLMGFLTPLDGAPFTYLPKTMEGNTTQNINEHLPMTIANQTDVLSAVMILLAILIFSKAKIKLSDLFMIGGLTYLMLVSRRQLSMFAIIGSIIFAKLIIQVIDIYIENGRQKVSKFFTNWIVIIVITALTIGIAWTFGKEKLNEEIIDNKTYPVEASNYILGNIDLGKAKFYNEYNYGSYLLFRGIPVFIDSRADLYAPEFSGLKNDIFMDFIETSNISKFYEDVFEKYEITHLITYKNSKMNMIITKTKDENYKELYVDDSFVIYERQNAKNQEIL